MMTEIKVNIIKFEFYGSSFEAYYAGGGLYLVPIRNLVEALGMKYSGQFERIQRHPVLANGVHTLKMDRPYGDTGATRSQEISCLDLRKVPFYMGGIDLGHIEDPDKKERILAYQEQYADVAWAAFRSDMTTDTDALAEVDMYEPPEKREYYKLMDDAATLRRLMEDVESTIGSLAPIVEQVQALTKGQLDLEQLAEEVVSRLRVLDARLSSVSTPISALKALTLRKMVQKLGSALTAKDRKRQARNERFWIRQVWDWMYQRFGVDSYHKINASDFETAVEFLRGIWKREIGGELPDEFSGWQPSMLD